MFTQSTRSAITRGKLSRLYLPFSARGFRGLTEELFVLHCRQKFVFEKLVTHLHDFAREVSLTTDEWMYVFSPVHRVFALGSVLTCICGDLAAGPQSSS